MAFFWGYQYNYRRLKGKRKGAGHEKKYLLAVLMLGPFGDDFMIEKYLSYIVIISIFIGLFQLKLHNLVHNLIIIKKLLGLRQVPQGNRRNLSRSYSRQKKVILLW